MSIELISEDLFKQKLEYIHYNPVKVGLCEVPEDYYYSSARFYEDGTNNFGMLKHYSEIEFGFVIPLVGDQTGAFLIGEMF